MTPPAIYMLKISCSSLERSGAFYAELGYTPGGPEATAAAPWLSSLYGVEDARMRVQQLQGPEGGAALRLELIEWAPPRATAGPAIDTPGSSALTVRIDDLDATVAALTRAGGKVIGAPASLSSRNATTRLVNVSDPDGLTLQLVEVRRLAPAERQ